MDGILVLAGFALPWILGIALLGALPRRGADPAAPAEIAWLLGCGWFVGVFVLTLWMRALSAAGVPFGIVSIGAPVGAVAAVLAWLAARRHAREWRADLRAAAREAAAKDLATWGRIVWFAVLGWLALRFVLLLAEVWWRPLFPWDAWSQWGTKARVWFELKTMGPFVTASEWLNANAPNVYFDAAPHYPATVPLFQVWAAVLAGRWDDSLVNLPWWLAGVAFGFAIYGALRHERLDPLPALLGTWLTLSVPILDTHIALAGYADLPMATYFTLGALAALRWLETRSASDLAIALLLLGAGIVIKTPGIIWVLVLIPGLAVALLPRWGLRVAALVYGVAATGVLILARSEVRMLGYRLHLDFEPPIRALYDAYFALGNWHLLWYAAIAVALLGWRHLLSRDLAPLTIVIAGGIGFLMFGFVFTNARQWVEDQSTVNRATLHLAPLVIVWMLLTFRAWASGLRPKPSPAVGEAPGASA